MLDARAVGQRPIAAKRGGWGAALIAPKGEPGRATPQRPWLGGVLNMRLCVSVTLWFSFSFQSKRGYFRQVPLLVENRVFKVLSNP